MSRTYHVEPQRTTGRGWQTCEPHSADRWAVIETKRWKAKGRTCAVSRVIERFPNASLAHKLQDCLTIRARPLPKPSLGQRFKRTERKIIARSL